MQSTKESLEHPLLKHAVSILERQFKHSLFLQIQTAFELRIVTMIQLSINPTCKSVLCKATRFHTKGTCDEMPNVVLGRIICLTLGKWHSPDSNVMRGKFQILPLGVHSRTLAASLQLSTTIIHKYGSKTKWSIQIHESTQLPLC